MFTNTNFLVTGIPRSGTSLLAALLSSWPNTVVFNEPPELSGPQLLRNDPLMLCNIYLEHMRKKILKGETIANKYSAINNSKTEVATDTWTGIVTENRFIAIDQNLPVNLSAKMTMPFLEHLPALSGNDSNFKVVAMVRNPIDTIASWKKTFGNLRECAPGKTIPWSKRFILSTDSDTTLRQIVLWRQLEEVIYESKDNPKLFIIKLDDLVIHHEEISHKLCDFLNIPWREWDPCVFRNGKSKSDTLTERDKTKIKELCLGKIFN